MFLQLFQKVWRTLQHLQIFRITSFLITIFFFLSFLKYSSTVKAQCLFHISCKPKLFSKKLLRILRVHTEANSMWKTAEDKNDSESLVTIPPVHYTAKPSNIFWSLWILPTCLKQIDIFFKLDFLSAQAVISILLTFFTSGILIISNLPAIISRYLQAAASDILFLRKKGLPLFFLIYNW